METFKTQITIYGIQCVPTGRIYIGKTCGYEGRIRSHMSLLRCHKHRNALMQSDFDAYGESAFVFEILDVVEREAVKDTDGKIRFTDCIRERERMIQYQTYDPGHGYNYKDRYFTRGKRKEG